MRSSSPWKDERVVLRELLRSVRKEQGLMQSALAQKLSLPQSYVSKVERGDRRIDVVELREWCCACKVDLHAFIERFEQILGLSGGDLSSEGAVE